MAEHSFREVMHEVNRLCMAQKNCDNDCPLDNMGCCGNFGAHCSDPLRVERIEDIVMSWAAEHPEPVYPSIAKYLERFGITIRRDGSLQADFFKAHEPMSADTAEKLGVKPKEGT